MPEPSQEGNNEHQSSGNNSREDLELLLQGYVRIGGTLVNTNSINFPSTDTNEVHVLLPNGLNGILVYDLPLDNNLISSDNNSTPLGGNDNNRTSSNNNRTSSNNNRTSSNNNPNSQVAIEQSSSLTNDDDNIYDLYQNCKD